MDKEHSIIGALFVVWCIFLPWSLAVMQIAAVLIFVTSISFAILNKRNPIKWHRFYVFLLLYLLSHLITICTVSNPSKAMSAALSNDWMLLLVPIIGSLDLTPRWRKISLYVLLISSGMAGVYGIIQFFTGFEYFRGKHLGLLGNYYRAVGGYGGFFEFAGNQLMVFGIGVAVFIKGNLNRGKKILLLSICLIGLLAIIASQTRSAWLAALFIVLLVMIISARKYVIHALTAVIILTIVIFIFFPDMNARFQSIFNPAKNEARLNIWRTSVEIFKDHMFVGIGHGNYDEYFDKYRVPGYYDAQGHAHNDYLNVAVLNGILGLLTWIGMWVSWFIYSIRIYLQPDLNSFDHAVILGGILSIAGILAASIFECYYTDLENNIMWWFIVILQIQMMNRYLRQDS